MYVIVSPPGPLLGGVISEHIVQRPEVACIESPTATTDDCYTGFSYATLVFAVIIAFTILLFWLTTPPVPQSQDVSKLADTDQATIQMTEILIEEKEDTEKPDGR